MRPFHKIVLLSAAGAASAVFAADGATVAASAAEAGVTNETAKAAVSADPGFARYQTIIDRQPFGPPPPGFDPSLPAGQQTGGAGATPADGGRTEVELSAEEQKMMSSVRVSVLNVTPSGSVMVGFTDSTIQPPVNYYLKVGETSTDSAKWLVKEANPAEGTVSLSKDGIDITLNVGGETKKGTPAPPAPGKSASSGLAGGSPGITHPLRGRIQPGGAESRPQDGGALARLHEKRMQRQAAEVAQRQAAETARMEREARMEAERAEREARMEAERAEREARMEAERAEQRNALLQTLEELRMRNQRAKDAEDRNNQ